LTLCLLIDRVTHQAEFDLCDVYSPKVVDEIAPGVSESADSRDHGYDTAGLCHGNGRAIRRGVKG